MYSALLYKTFTFSLDELLLSNELENRFLRALSCVGVPVCILDYYVKKLLVTCQRNSEQDFRNTYNKLMDELYSEEPNSKNVNKMHGNMFKQISAFKGNVQSLSGMLTETFCLRIFYKIGFQESLIRQSLLKC